MAGERENAFAIKELRGVTYTENDAASLLEQHLGIVIPEHPKTVVLTPRNRLALYRDPEFRQNKKLSLMNVLLKDTVWFAGHYAYEYNACILRQNPKENGDMASLHEAMHAFIDQTNPEIPKHMRSIFDKGKNDPTSYNYETIEAYQIFQEGIASWGELETTEIIKGTTYRIDRRAKHQEWIKKSLHSIGKDDNIDHCFANIKERADFVKNTANDIYSPQFKQNIKKWNTMFKNRYVQTTSFGNYFVEEVISNLISQGLNIGDALRLLILHPPQWPRALDQLQNPVAYADELIVYYTRGSRRLPKEN